MKQDSNKDGIKEEIWKVRQYIQSLEDIKNEIAKHLDTLKGLDDATKRIWISDGKEFYYYIVSAWEMLRASPDGELKKLETSKSFLYGARNRLSQISSELKIFQNKKSSELILRAENAFEECWDAFWTVFKKLSPIRETMKSIEKVIKISDLEYHLSCSVCGEIAVKFKIGYGRFDKTESLVFRGITHETSLNTDLANDLFEMIQEKDLQAVHSFMKNHHTFEGLDAYCPECDKIYCWEHYNAKEEFDDGFYDCTYGECPKGHKRMIDD